MWILKNLCMFATLKFFSRGQRELPSVASGVFYARNHTQYTALNPVSAMETPTSPLVRTLAAGSGRRFFCPHAKQIYKLC